MRAFFYDTWAFLALANAGDPYHSASVAADRRLEETGYVGVTSDYVYDETMTGLSFSAGWRVALEFSDLLFAKVEAQELLLAEINRPRREEALKVFRRLSPSERRPSFTDCSSFVVMKELKLELAFTADRHFHRAGLGIRPLFEHHRGQLILRVDIR